MDIREKRLLLFDALLSSKGIQKLIDAASDLMENPIAVIDMGLSPIVVSSELCRDKEWMNSQYETRPIDIKHAAQAGDFKRVYSSDATVLGEYPGAKQRYLAARIRRGSNVLGHTLVLERNRQFETGDWELLPDICRTFGYELAGHRELDQLSEHYGTLLEDLLRSRLTDRREIEARMRRAKINVADHLVVLVFSPTSYIGQISARHLRQQLLLAFPSSIGVVDGESVALVIESKLTQGDFSAMLSQRVYSESLLVGMSREFSGFWNVRFAYEQASAAVRLSGEAENGTRVVHYDEVVAAHLVELAAASEDTRVFDHPAIEALTATDECDNGTYLHDLEAYLLSSRNAVEAARICCVHKNTMYYRLRKIEEIANIDLSDETTCFALQLSLAMRKTSIKKPTQ